MSDINISSMDEAQELANQVYAGELKGQEAEAATVAIESYMKKMQSPLGEGEDSTEKMNWLTRMGENVEKRQMMLTDVMEATADGEQTYAEGMLQTAGKYGAGLVADFVAETVVSGGRGLAKVDGWTTGGKGAELVTRAGNAFLETEIGEEAMQKLMEGGEAYSAWASANPRAARNVEAVVNVAALTSPKIPIKGAISKVTGGPIAAVRNAGPVNVGSVSVQNPFRRRAGVADTLRRSADETQWRRDDKWATQMVRPLREQMSEAEVNQMTFRTEAAGRGLLTRGKVPKNAAEETLVDTFLGIEGVKPSNFLFENANLVRRGIADQGAKLQAYIKKNEKLLSLDDLNARMGVVKQKLKTDISVIGDAPKAAEEVIDKYLTVLNKGPTWTNKQGQTMYRASDILRARKEVDEAFSRAGRSPNSKADIGSTETGAAVALRETRREMNDILNEAMGGDDFVKKSLHKQANMYRINESLLPKAAKEVTNYFGRAWKFGMKFLPYRGEANQMAALLLGMGGLGAGGVVGPLMAGAVWSGAGGYLAYAAATAPTTRRLIAGMIDGTNTVLKGAAKGTQAAIETKAHRAFLLRYLESLNDGDLPLPPMTERDLVGSESEDDEEKLRENVGE